ncbi:MAG: NAD/NADP octopine/nopaline dehydrogenase family protein [Verrucomicrobiae bacterium]|nr:NAD/NADP octopine/nopaline dehydrogenase family protein [Verrucomicrobiae bacterium]
MIKKRYAVFGAGHGGKSMAAHLALMGFPVALYNRTPANIEAIKARQGIMLDSFPEGPHGFGRLDLVTSDLEQAVQFADILMVVVPSSAHGEIARLCARCLRAGQTIILHPGRTGGAVEFVKVLADSGCQAEVTVAEAGTLIYACRSTGPAQAHLFSIKAAVPLAALPATRTAQVLEAVNAAFPQYIAAANVLQTGLDNMGAVFHPALTILNAGWIECAHAEFEFYLDGVSPSTARVLEVLDRERVTIAAALGVRSHTAIEWLEQAYNVEGSNLYEAVQNNTGYEGIKAPPTLEHRYISEDVPMSLVPIAALGRRYGVSTRAIDAIINLASMIHSTDYWRRGRTLEKLGIDGMSVSELRRYVEEGVRDK